MGGGGAPPSPTTGPRACLRRPEKKNTHSLVPPPALQGGARADPSILHAPLDAQLLSFLFFLSMQRQNTHPPSLSLAFDPHHRLTIMTVCFRHKDHFPLCFLLFFGRRASPLLLLHRMMMIACFCMHPLVVCNSLPTATHLCHHHPCNYLLVCVLLGAARVLGGLGRWRGGLCGRVWVPAAFRRRAVPRARRGRFCAVATVRGSGASGTECARCAALRCVAVSISLLPTSTSFIHLLAETVSEHTSTHIQNSSGGAKLDCKITPCSPVSCRSVQGAWQRSNT